MPCDRSSPDPRSSGDGLALGNSQCKDKQTPAEYDAPTIGKGNAAERTASLQQLKRASDKIGTLVDAALALDA